MNDEIKITTPTFASNLWKIAKSWRAAMHVA